MCLDYILPIKYKNPKAERIGWKTFLVWKGTKKKRCICGFFYERGYIPGKWYDASNVKIRSNVSRKYESGFHIWKRKKDAIESFGTVMKVKYKNVVATGYQASRKIDVAKKMMIIEDANR